MSQAIAESAAPVININTSITDISQCKLVPGTTNLFTIPGDPNFYAQIPNDLLPAGATFLTGPAADMPTALFNGEVASVTTFNSNVMSNYQTECNMYIVGQIQQPPTAVPLVALNKINMPDGSILYAEVPGPLCGPPCPPPISIPKQAVCGNLFSNAIAGHPIYSAGVGSTLNASDTPNTFVITAVGQNGFMLTGTWQAVQIYMGTGYMWLHS